MSGGELIAIDWGTTNRRIHVLKGDGTVVRTSCDDRGVLKIAAVDYPLEIAALRQRHGQLPVIAAGMVGSSRGWIDVPYCEAPAGLADLAAGAHRCSDEVLLLPGLCLRNYENSDVMRGEEIQVLGALSKQLAEGRALFCQPGTHNKWIETSSNRIVDFATAMTGEVFSLLKAYSVLSEFLKAEAVDGAAFREGLVRGAGARDLLTALFQARAAGLLGLRGTEDSASYVSGLLIGADVGSREDLADREVLLLSSGALGDLYAAAIGWAGGVVRTIDSDAAFAAGVHAIWEKLK